MVNRCQPSAENSGHSTLGPCCLNDDEYDTPCLVHSAKFDWRARISGVPLAAIDVLVTEEQRSNLSAELTQANVEMIEAGAGMQDGLYSVQAP